MVDVLPYQPVIVIGAGRSGTKMLREALVRLPGAGTWPCDEINYIWRHGNARHRTDELDPSAARPEVRRFVRRAFDRLADRHGLTHVVEKTCANSLRVPFVRRVLPEARFVFIVRDGRDVTASALRRWRAPLDLVYIARKARFVPVSDLPYYALRYLWNRAHRLVSKEQRLSWWGPRFEGMEEAARADDLATLCARQWVRCVEKADLDLAELPTGTVFRLRYEDFVREPAPRMAALAGFLGIDAEADTVDRCIEHVSTGSVGGWRTGLTDEQRERVEPVLAETLRRFSYSEGP